MGRWDVFSFFLSSLRWLVAGLSSGFSFSFLCFDFAYSERAIVNVRRMEEHQVWK